MVFLQPLEDFKSDDFGHFQIEEQKRRNWEADSIRESIGTAQVTDGPLAVRNFYDGAREACLLKGAPEKKHVVGIIVSHKDCGLRTHNIRIATGCAGSRQ